MSLQTLLLEIRDGIAFLTINRPDKLNALNDTVVAELHDAARALKSNSDVRGVILTGSGPKAFVAGADIGDLAKQGVLDGRNRALSGQAMLRDFETMGKPVLAAVNGFALGGGCELAMACHIRIASENARFGQPEVNLGLIPGAGGTQRLARIVGMHRAKELNLLGEMIDAREAHRIGIANRVVPADRLMTEARALVDKLIAKAPITLRLIKEAMNEGYDLDLPKGLAIEAKAWGVVYSTEDKTEGVAAFLEKRKPAFKGR